MLGKWNWWSPKPLRRLHGRVGISETAPVVG
jgi:RND superfamily putative drug exporter